MDCNFAARFSRECREFLRVVIRILLPALFRQRFRADALPIDCRIPRFGSVFCKVHRQALAGLSWLSHSRPLDLPAVPEVKSPPVRPVARLETPHAGQVKRSSRPRIPCAGLRNSFIEITSPALINGGLENVSRYFRITPAQANGSMGQSLRDRFASDRIVGLLGALTTGIRDQSF